MRRLLVLVPLLAMGLAACGNERQEAPSVPKAATPSGRSTEHFARFGVTFSRPRNWTVQAGRAPQLASVGSGRAVISLWRYRRVERLPRTGPELAIARKALVAAVRRGDRTIRIVSARTLRIGGAPAVEIVADERIGRARRQVRSTHVYAHGTELVVDAYAPPDEFRRIDRETFVPLVRSLRVAPPRGPAAGS